MASALRALPEGNPALDLLPWFKELQSSEQSLCNLPAATGNLSTPTADGEHSAADKSDWYFCEIRKIGFPTKDTDIIALN